jgi:peptidoglycan/LPS O-acetylase OafA/YrhL
VSKPRLQFMDTLRGFAILGVFIFHSVWEISGNPMRWKDGLWDPDGFPLLQSVLQYALQCYSVPSMFFLMSGFLIHRHQTSGRVVDLRYLARRNLRLYLPYLVVLAIFVAAYFTPRPPGFIAPNKQELALHVLLLFGYFGNGSAWAINPSFWFVAVEIQLCFAYLLWRPLIGRFGWMPLMVVLFVIEVLTRIGATTADNGWMYTIPFAFGFTWMLGALLAEMLARQSLPSRSGLKAAGWGVVIVISTGIENLQYFASMALAAGTYYLMSWLLQRDGQAQATEAAPAARWHDGIFDFVRAAGRISLWVYLLNQPILYYIALLVRPNVEGALPQTFATAFIGWLVVLPLAWLLQRYLEPQLVRVINAVTGAPVRPAASEFKQTSIRRPS